MSLNKKPPDPFKRSKKQPYKTLKIPLNYSTRQ